MSIRIPSGANLLSAAAVVGGGNPENFVFGAWMNFDACGDGAVFFAYSFESTQPVIIQRVGSSIQFDSRSSDGPGPTVSVPRQSGWGYYAVRLSHSGVIDAFASGTKYTGGAQGYLSARNVLFGCTGSGYVEVWKAGAWAAALTDAEIFAKAGPTPEASPLPYNFWSFNQTTGDVENGDPGIADTGVGGDATLTINAGTPVWTANPTFGKPAVAYWNFPPNVDVTVPTRIGVCASHTSGYGSVSIAVNGGTATVVNRLATNPDSGSVELFKLVDPTAIAGPVTLTGTYTPPSGPDFTLPPLVVHANPSTALPTFRRFLSPTGTGDGLTQSTPRAIDFIDLCSEIAALDGQGGYPDGLEINLLAGSYPVKSSEYYQRFAGNSRPVVIQAAPGVDPDTVLLTGTTPNSGSSYDSLVITYVVFRNLTVTSIVGGPPVGYTVGQWLWENVWFKGSNRLTDSFDDASGVQNRFVNCHWSDCLQGPSQAVLVRGCTAERIGESGLRGCLGLIVDTYITDVDRQTGTLLHPDSYVNTNSPDGVLIQNCWFNNPAAPGMRLQESATNFHVVATYINAEDAILAWEMERPYDNVRSYANVLVGGVVYDGTFSADGVYIDNTPNNAGAHAGVTIRSLAPSYPIDFRVTSSAGSVSLSWKVWTGDHEGCVLQRSTAADFTADLVETTIANNGTAVTHSVARTHARNDNAVTVGTTYYYRVSATNTAGASGWSDVVSTTVTTDPGGPGGGTPGTLSGINLLPSMAFGFKL